jgi:hypothetical protein
VRDGDIVLSLRRNKPEADASMARCHAYA